MRSHSQNVWNAGAFDFHRPRSAWSMVRIISNVEPAVDSVCSVRTTSGSAPGVIDAHPSHRVVPTAASATMVMSDLNFILWVFLLAGCCLFRLVRRLASCAVAVLHRNLVITKALRQKRKHLSCRTHRRAESYADPVDRRWPLARVYPLSQSGDHWCRCTNRNEARSFGDDDCGF